MLLEAHMKLCLTEVYFAKKIFFAPKIWKMYQKWAKNRVF